jgi:hypothetical protein
MDCRETDEVSVLLLSITGRPCVFAASAACGRGGGPELRGLVIPVISMFLKLSTSKDGFVALGGPLSAAARSTAGNVSICARACRSPLL